MSASKQPFLLWEASLAPAGKKLSGREGWRIRVGRYRVIYEIDDEVKRVTVLHVGRRKDVYRNR